MGHFEPPPQPSKSRNSEQDKSETESLMEEAETEDLTSLFPYYNDLVQDMVFENDQDIEIKEAEINENDIALEIDLDQVEQEKSLMEGLTPVGKLDSEKDDIALKVDNANLEPKESPMDGLTPVGELDLKKDDDSDMEEIVSLDGEEIPRGAKELENIMDKLEISEDYDEGIYDSQDHLLLPLYDYV